MVLNNTKLTNKEILSHSDIECEFSFECSECPIFEQCSENIQQDIYKVMMDKMSKDYPINTKLISTTERDEHLVTGYMYNKGEYFILLDNLKVNYKRVGACYEKI